MKVRITESLDRYVGNFKYFYNYLGNKIFISLALSLVVGVLDGFGLAMFLPLIQMADGGSASLSQMGNLSFLLTFLGQIGILLTLQNVLLIILFFFTLKGSIKFIEGYYKVILQQVFIRKVRFRNIDLLSSLRYTNFVTSDSGRIQNTLTGEVDKVLQAYRAYFTAIQYAILVLVYIVLAFMANPQFAILVAVGGVLTNFIFRRIYFLTKKLSKRLTMESHSFQGLLIQNVSNFKYLKASGLIFLYAKKLKTSITKIEESQRKIGILGTTVTSLREPIVMLVVVLVILIQINFFSAKLALIILSLLFFYRSLAFLMALQNFWNTFLSLSGSMENMTKFAEELTQYQEDVGTIKFERFVKKMELINLNFSYDKEPLLKSIGVRINKNETVAIVGQSGSGKTTLLNILTGLISVEPGAYVIDEKDSREIDITTFQNRIGYITQEPVIFDDTIYNNVTFWAEVSIENMTRFYQAVRAASLDEFVQSQPDKENSRLGVNGVMISGGQKQRISIARELFKEIDILFMDEATSALDSETEMSIRGNIDKLKGTYTIIIIAHRLSTIKSADRILFLNEGVLECEGDFESLQELSPKFKRMVDLQEF